MTSQDYLLFFLADKINRDISTSHNQKFDFHSNHEFQVEGF